MENKKNNIVEEATCFFPTTKQLLENEVKLLVECRDGVAKAWNYLKKNGIDDNHLRDLYYNFDSKLKEYNLSIDVLMEESKRNCCGS